MRKDPNVIDAEFEMISGPRPSPPPDERDGLLPYRAKVILRWILWPLIAFGVVATVFGLATAPPQGPRDGHPSATGPAEQSGPPAASYEAR